MSFFVCMRLCVCVFVPGIQYYMRRAPFKIALYRFVKFNGIFVSASKVIPPFGLLFSLYEFHFHSNVNRRNAIHIFGSNRIGWHATQTIFPFNIMTKTNKHKKKWFFVFCVTRARDTETENEKETQRMKVVLADIQLISIQERLFLTPSLISVVYLCSYEQANVCTRFSYFLSWKSRE